MRFKAFLILLSMIALGSASSGQTTPNANAPLSTDELREGILRIEQGILAAKEADLLRKSMADRDALAERERAIAARELETEKQRIGIANERVTLETTRAEFYRNAFETVTKRTSFGCKMARVFTLGLAKCGRP